ncbi:MAG TPA: hypothetical protein PLK12_12410, partial [Prolixibacteraceae bacterium]|nr:hypothetical protein [Prolixibacteraceae bacterium]
WKLDKQQSQLNDQFSMAPEKLIVTQDNNQLKLERHASFQGDPFIISDQFTLDGKECVNPGWMDSQKKSTAVWDANKKKITIVTKIPMQDGAEMVINEEISIDNGKMVIKSHSSSSWGEGEETMVFSKE